MSITKLEKDFEEKYRYARTWSKEMDDDYRKLMKSLLRNRFGIHGGCEEILNSMCDCGWEKFVETENERKATMEMIVEWLIADILYFSGAWMWDRFLCVQWLYQRIKRREKYGEYRQVSGEVI